jgi:hypothetical protein
MMSFKRKGYQTGGYFYLHSPVFGFFTPFLPVFEPETTPPVPIFNFLNRFFPYFPDVSVMCE